MLHHIHTYTDAPNAQHHTTKSPISSRKKNQKNNIISCMRQDYFQTKDFPKNLPAIWNAHWGFAKALTGGWVFF